MPPVAITTKMKESAANTGRGWVIMRTAPARARKPKITGNTGGMPPSSPMEARFSTSTKSPANAASARTVAPMRTPALFGRIRNTSATAPTAHITATGSLSFAAIT